MLLLCGTLLFTLFHDVDFVWLPGTALVTTALCWLPGRCWSYSQYSLEICYATEYFWYWRRYINSWRLWDLVFGIRNLVWDLEVFVGIRNSVWGFRKCLESLWHYNTISRSLRREDTDFTGRVLIAQGGYWSRREDIDCVSVWMKSVVSRRIEHRSGRMPVSDH